MLDKLLHKHEKEDKKHVWSLGIMDRGLCAGLWQIDHDALPAQLGIAYQNIGENDEGLLTAADMAISSLEEKLPEGQTVDRVIFGLMPDHLEGNNIKHEFLTKLKKITTALSLTPLGFVELPQALSYLLKAKEGGEQTVIFIGLEDSKYTVTLFKVGRMLGSFQGARTADVAHDIETALTQFGSEVLPSRMLLYGTAKDLEEIKEVLMQYPWQSKANFLHVPRIEVLPSEYLATAVVYASVNDLKVVLSPEPEVIPAAPSEASAVLPSSVPQRGEAFGFVSENLDAPEHDTAIVVPPHAPHETPHPASRRFALPQLPKMLQLPALSHHTLPVAFTFHMPSALQSGKLMLIPAVLAGLGMLIGAAVWNIPRAQVAVVVDPQEINQQESFMIAPDTAAFDATQKLLGGKSVTIEVKGEKSLPATGKKTIGDKATGQVTIFNKTLNTKVLKKGTLLTAKNLSFTLNDEVTIASASESVGSLTYGKQAAKITAAEIGTEGNVSSNTEFVFKDFPASSYSARNDAALGGGTSREISVISRDDQEKLTKELLDELEKQAAQNVSQQLSAGETLLSRSLLAQKTTKTFNKEPGEEAKDVQGAFTAVFTGLAYKQDELYDMLSQHSTTTIPEGFEVRKEGMSVEVTAITQEKNGPFKVDGTVRIQLVPKLDTTALAGKIAGKTIDEARAIIAQIPHTQDIDVTLVKKFPFMTNRLPFNAAHIVVAPRVGTEVN